MSEGITAHHGIIEMIVVLEDKTLSSTFTSSRRLKISRKGQTTLINTVVTRSINLDIMIPKNSENRQDPYNPNNYYCNEKLKLH